MIEETREKTLLIPPPDVVPMWCQLKESGDYCGFMITKKSEPSWRVANHGSFQLNKDLAAHHPRLHAPQRSTDSREKHPQ